MQVAAMDGVKRAAEETDFQARDVRRKTGDRHRGSLGKFAAVFLRKRPSQRRYWCARPGRLGRLDTRSTVPAKAPSICAQASPLRLMVDRYSPIRWQDALADLTTPELRPRSLADLLVRTGCKTDLCLESNPTVRGRQPHPPDPRTCGPERNLQNDKALQTECRRCASRADLGGGSSLYHCNLREVSDRTLQAAAES